MRKPDKKKAKKGEGTVVKPARGTELTDKDLERVRGGSENGFVQFGDAAGEPSQQHDFIQYILKR
jgi:hypothetical protein